MSKKTMWILLIVGLAVTIIGAVAYAITILSLAITPPDPYSTPLNMSGMLVGFGIAITFLLIGGIIELIGRIGMMIKQAKQQQWAWFVCTLLLGWVCMLIYLIVWPEATQPVMPTPYYVPQYQPMQPYQSYQAVQQPHYYETGQQQIMEQRAPQE